MLYFAYGSNMDAIQMKARCPGATKVGIARLPDHQLSFPRLSKGRGCGVSSVTAADGHEVWGVVYCLTTADTVRLDANEGFVAGREAHLNSYYRTKISVVMNDIAIEVETYIGVPQEAPPLPNLEYLRLIRKGAKAHDLPEGYRALLDAIVASDQKPIA
ncbi:gamma-glutamylcyclotransferase (plasmid) [Mesorhizobium loti]|uniref:Gamma-glutamylcyclotransferase n=1 Tax=Mesorhizobium jarvisii TaxID=1777867 RepID=A0A6M7TRM5_9HYPH|nr:MULTISPECIES: gamma-glutamylcyclotransferase family protein [Mesorhizobium]OBQ66493.1 hypothetical protein A9K72_34650 [Mesorhizobium loti]QKC67654.1 gamma-glutamylcyclotransferase [Mesorhizobium jarvisii]QKD13561.1 gamma-glutamylcyclotransferase [Mesorhizobium loti]RJT28178.1 gamma-glutamylcyclotransferase [Mesorhizobium jarvisii]